MDATDSVQENKSFVKPPEVKAINIGSILLQLLIFFIALTGLNVSIFAVMAFENQADLIVEVAIQTCQAQGLNIKNEIKKILDTYLANDAMLLHTQLDVQDVLRFHLSGNRLLVSLQSEADKIVEDYLKEETIKNEEKEKDPKANAAKKEPIKKEDPKSLLNKIPKNELSEKELLEQTKTRIKDLLQNSFSDKALLTNLLCQMNILFEGYLKNGALQHFILTEMGKLPEFNNLDDGLMQLIKNKAIELLDLQFKENASQKIELKNDILNTITAKLSESAINNGLGVKRFKILSEAGEVLTYQGYQEDENPSLVNPLEVQKINEAILSSELSNQLYKNDDVPMYFESINLYIPIDYGGQFYLIIKPTIPVPKAAQYLSYFFMIVLIAGIIMLGFHMGFAFISYTILVRPMKRANDGLSHQNELLEKRYREMEEELSIARELQKAIIPKKGQLQLDQIKIDQIYIPLEAVSGDYLDLIEIDEDHLGILVVDVSGHGIPSALVTTMAKVSFNTNSLPGRNTADICADVNVDLCRAIGESDYYCTAFYAILNLKTFDMMYTCAGHPKAIIWRASQNRIEEIKTRGFVIGSAEVAKFHFLETTLEKGDRMLIFSDGIIEAMNTQEEIYDYERLTTYVNANHHLDTEKFAQGVLDDVHRFTKEAPQSDDISLVLLDRV